MFTSIRLYALGGVAIAALLGTLYVQHLRSTNASLSLKTIQLESEIGILQATLRVNAEVKRKDDERATQAQEELKAFKERADAEISALKNPDRLCLDGDDTRSLQSIFNGDKVR
jgi:hypothetical protein